METALLKTIGVPSCSRYSSRSAQLHCLLGLPDTDAIPCSIIPT
ncbi:hypothetical protein PENNAL_c0473G04141 [Penicillium nalgiovense]|uniref:Uncharacterized protein n=1 Tax=Penicillium nalgiovense TaxID=60175 RepID=A0A1V6VRS7_PENNA|nr:hypothetical protein PENNAL_c0473G04141 [Penicillium nalgiovense]